jgi:hypothetical protein
MPLPTVPERLRDIEKSIESIQGWIKGLGIGAGLLVLVVGWWVGSDVMPTIHKSENDIVGNGKDIAELRGQLKGLLARQAKVEIQNVAQLAPKALAAVLPDLKSSFQIARTQNVKVPQTVVNTLREKLQHIGSSAPDFWPAISEFINYRSFNAARLVPEKLLATSLPNCTDSPLRPPVVSNILNPRQFQFIVPSYENCRVTLDSEKDDKEINMYLLRTSPMMDFKNCLVVYRGGAVNIIFYLPSKNGTDLMMGPRRIGTTKTKIAGQSVTFNECFFDFSIPTGIPSPTGQKMTQSLLAQNANNLILPYP